MADNAHYFHAEAHALTGMLKLPFKEEIKKQAFVKLEGELADLNEEDRAQRSYLSQHAKNFRLEGIISYATAHTQVSGHDSHKHDGASVTLATSVVEDLNVLNVVTADRVVGQISTTHIPGEYSPHVTFLGTHFENLRIFRHRVFPKLDLLLCGERPVGEDALYVRSSKFLEKVAGQYAVLGEKVNGLTAQLKAEEDAAIKLEEKKRWTVKDRKLDGLRDLPALVKQDYNAALLNKNILDKNIDDGIKAVEAKPKGEGLEAGRREWPGIKCSLVDKVEIEPPSKEQVSDPLRTFGHVIHVPDFGKIFLADLTVNHNSFHLTMIRLELGCLADGKVSIVNCNVNGKGSKGGG
jgi:hypothetical protein